MTSLDTFLNREEERKKFEFHFTICSNEEEEEEN